MIAASQEQCGDQPPVQRLAPTSEVHTKHELPDELDTMPSDRDALLALQQERDDLLSIGPLSRASTKNYAVWQRRWTAFCEEHDAPVCPADQVTFLAFLSAYGDDRSWKSVEIAAYAVRAMQVAAGLPDPMTADVRALLKGLARQPRTKQPGATPLTAAVARDILSLSVPLPPEVVAAIGFAHLLRATGIGWTAAVRLQPDSVLCNGARLVVAVGDKEWIVPESVGSAAQENIEAAAATWSEVSGIEVDLSPATAIGAVHAQAIGSLLFAANVSRSTDRHEPVHLLGRRLSRQLTLAVARAGMPDVDVRRPGVLATLPEHVWVRFLFELTGQLRIQVRNRTALVLGLCGPLELRHLQHLRTDATSIVDDGENPGVIVSVAASTRLDNPGYRRVGIRDSDDPQFSVIRHVHALKALLPECGEEPEVLLPHVWSGIDERFVRGRAMRPEPLATWLTLMAEHAGHCGPYTVDSLRAGFLAEAADADDATDLQVAAKLGLRSTRTLSKLMSRRTALRNSVLQQIGL